MIYMIEREASPILLSAATQFPVIAITGPRQSGKTTLCKMIFDDRPYVSFEEPNTRERFLDDPIGFLSFYKNGAVFDEAQRCPELFSYLQGIVDGDDRMGRFVLTGSAQFHLMEKITQSLAGRVLTLELLPFSLKELNVPDTVSIDEVMFQGGYPPIHDRDIPPGRWFSNYVRNYVERDVRELLQVTDLDTFQRFIRLAAARTGQLLNLSELGSAAGVSHNTVKSWISVLQASYIVYLARPYHANISKRLVKSPKLYFYDSALVCWLLSIQDTHQLNLHPMRGSIFETFVVSEMLKKRYNQLETDNLFFYRDHKGTEIDLIVDKGIDSVPIEIKSGMTFRPEHARTVKKWKNISGSAATPHIIFGGDQGFTQSDYKVVSWRNPHE